MKFGLGHDTIIRMVYPRPGLGNAFLNGLFLGGVNAVFLFYTALIVLELSAFFVGVGHGWRAVFIAGLEDGLVSALGFIAGAMAFRLAQSMGGRDDG